MGQKMKKLIDKVQELDEIDEPKFVEFDPDDITVFGGEAVQVEIAGKLHWLPYSQLRVDDGQLYASKWILAQKLIDV